MSRQPVTSHRVASRRSGRTSTSHRTLIASKRRHPRVRFREGTRRDATLRDTMRRNPTRHKATRHDATPHDATRHDATRCVLVRARRGFLVHLEMPRAGPTLLVASPTTAPRWMKKRLPTCLNTTRNMGYKSQVVLARRGHAAAHRCCFRFLWRMEAAHHNDETTRTHHLYFGVSTII